MKGKTTLKDLIVEAMQKGLMDYASINKYITSRGGRETSKFYIAHTKKDYLEGRITGAVPNNPSKSYIASADNIRNNSINQTVSPPVERQGTIEGNNFSLQGETAPIQQEASELAKTYQESNPETVTKDAVMVDPAAGANPTPNDLRVDTSAPMAPQEQQTVDLTMFASMPAVMEDIIFAIPRVQKMTDGYKPEKADLDNITHYTTVLMQKHSGEVVTKHAEELNFIGAMIVPVMKGFGKKLADVVGHLGQKKKSTPPTPINQTESVKEYQSAVEPPRIPHEFRELRPMKTPEQLHEEELQRIADEVAKSQNP